MIAYRADIDGMRALAVVAVLLFHLEFSAFQGGFVGVDVFFVISGFLITSIIRRSIDAETFKLRDFYLRRVRRLVPPLVATVAAALIAASFILTPIDMIAMGRSAVAALFSVSNVLFFTESGYWDADAELKPLLHTWSLGVEEQFYLFWPALVVGLAKLERRISFRASITAILVAGFFLMLWFANVDQTAVFFLFPFRVFQFAAGAAIGTMPMPKRVDKWQREAVFVVGLALVVFSILSYDDTTAFPSLWAVPPTLGAVLLVVAGSLPGGQGRLGTLLLTGPISTWLGRMSYALYLVHWPIIALYRYQTGLELGFQEQVGLVAASLIAAMVLHHGVERRFYTRAASQSTKRPSLSLGRFALATLVVSAVLAGVASTAWAGDGWSWRYQDISLTAEEIDAGKAERFSLLSEGCRLRTFDQNAETTCSLDAPQQVLVFGNSHEPDGYNFLRGLYEADEVDLIAFGTANQCEDWGFDGETWFSSNDDCQRRLTTLFETPLVDELDLVVYSAFSPFTPNKELSLEFLQELKRRNTDLRVVIYGGYLSTTFPCAQLVNTDGSTDACLLPDNVATFEDNPGGLFFDEFMALADHYIDRVDLLCEDRDLARCTSNAPSGEPMFYDKHHNSLEFSLHVGSLYREQNPALVENFFE